MATAALADTREAPWPQTTNAAAWRAVRECAAPPVGAAAEPVTTLAIPDQPHGDSLLAGLIAPPGLRDLAVRLAMVVLFFAVMGLLIGQLPRRSAEELTGLPSDKAPVSAAFDNSARTLPLPDPAAVVALSEGDARQSNAAAALHPPTEAAPPWTMTIRSSLPESLAAARARAVDCLAAAAWYEAGDDPAGERAVIQVVLNRARHPAFPGTVCGVVFQGAQRSTGCQFTFTCDGSLVRRQPQPPAWARARAIAKAALAGAVVPAVGLATHYHADYVVPTWRDGLVKLAQVGAHLFYRWPAQWGSRAVLRRASDLSDEPFVPALAAISEVHGARLAYDPAALAAGAAAIAMPSASPAPDGVAILAQLAARHQEVPGGIAPPGTAARSPATESIDLPLEPGTFAGSYAIKAYALCKDKPRCVVIGRITGAELAHADGANRLGFLYVHDSRTGAEGVWWNCARTPRADRQQCLPDGPAAARLVASWL